ncbi:hypothetical protein ACWZEH_00075 [Streptomyces sp. QTS137]
MPPVRGDRALTTQQDRTAALDRFAELAKQAVTSYMQPTRPALVGRRQVRFEGDPTGQLHRDGSLYAALILELADQLPSSSDKRLYQRGLELYLVTQVHAAAAWAVDTGAGGDLMLSAKLRFDDGITPVRLVVSERQFQHGSVGPIPRTPAQNPANLILQL